MDQPDSDTDWVFVGDSKEAVMQRFIHRQNLEHFRERLAEAADEAERERLLKLFAEEETKDQSPPDKSDDPDEDGERYEAQRTG